MSPVITVTRDELEERRRTLLAGLGMTLDEFEQMAATKTLSGPEVDVEEELAEIAFLLGE